MMMLGQEVPSPLCLARGYSPLATQCGAVGSKLRADSSKGSWRESSQLPVVCAAVWALLWTQRRALFCSLSDTPTQEKEAPLSDAVATSSSEAPANLRFAAHRARGSRTAGSGPLGSFQEQGPGFSPGCGGHQDSQVPRAPALESLLHVPQSACLSVPLHSSVKERDDWGADGELSPTRHPQPPGKAN